MLLFHQVPPTTGKSLDYFYPHIREICKVLYKKSLSCNLTLLVIPCLFMQYEKILMVWVRITLGFQPRVIRTQTINIVRIA